MLKKSLLATALVTLTSTAVLASVQVGQVAPDFKLTDTSGKSHTLSDYKGKYVVLEWVNPNCPFVVKHYGSGNMQGLQKEFGGKDVVWLAINSTNPKHQDYMKPADLSHKITKDWGGAPKAVLMDEPGGVGKQYGARTTPHMYIVDPKGHLVYAGGIDDKRSANPEDIKTSKNYLRAAFADLYAGKAVNAASTTPYGCSVKYN